MLMALTTLHQDTDKLAEDAVDPAFSRRAGPEAPSCEIVPPPRLVTAQTTGPRRSA